MLQLSQVKGIKFPMYFARLLLQGLLFAGHGHSAMVAIELFKCPPESMMNVSFRLFVFLFLRYAPDHIFKISLGKIKVHVVNGEIVMTTGP